MGAFNWINFENRCPVCDQVAKIISQTHVASDYGGNDKGRFHDKIYQLGQKMAWWPSSDYRYRNWCSENKIMEELHTSDYCEECTYARCTNCGSELYAVISFKEVTPIEVLEIGKEENWPANLPK